MITSKFKGRWKCNPGQEILLPVKIYLMVGDYKFWSTTSWLPLEIEVPIAFLSLTEGCLVVLVANME